MAIEATLVVVEGATEAEIPLKLPTVIGRSGQASLKVRTTVVSREHCKLFEKKGSLFVEDLNSSNGTFVNEEKINSVTKLTSGDFITVGPVTLRVVCKASERTRSLDPYSGESGVLNDIPQDSDSESQSHIHYKETVEGSFLGIDDSMLQALGPQGQKMDSKKKRVSQKKSPTNREKSSPVKPDKNTLFKEKGTKNSNRNSKDQSLDDFLNNFK